jgi:hypothetical protein
MAFDDNSVIAFQTKRAFNMVAKGLLMLLEDLQQDHNINFDKLKKNLPEFEFLINQADYFDDAKFAHYRKRILDIANSGLRELSDEIRKFDLTLKQE